MDTLIANPGPLVIAGMTVLVIFLLGMAAWLLRVMRRNMGQSKTDDTVAPTPRVDNESAFLSASVQSVIQRLKEQEKELDRLHRQEKERAEQTEQFIATVTRTMPTGLLLVNAAGLVTTANPAAEAALGIGSLSYRRFNEALGPDSPLALLLGQSLREGRTFQREEVDHRTPAGDHRRLGVTISPVLPLRPAASASPQKTGGALCLLSDLTELTALQKQVQLQESLAALGEMSAGIAHEFKNALAVISGYAQMIRNDPASGEVAESAERILAESKTLNHVVTEFLRYARPMEVSREPVELQPLVERIVAEVAEMRPDVALHCEGQFQNVSADKELLRQALRNLMRNAAEAVPAGAGGRVTVRGWREESAGRATQFISISDSGPGIAPADLPRVFLPFFTTKADGTGLGLAITQKIALHHGGGVEARNLAEGGAEFILWLPPGGPENRGS